MSDDKKLNEDIEVIKPKVTNGVYGYEKKDLTKKILKKSKPRDLEREKICKNARKKAHSAVADAKREISKEVRKSLSLSESLSLEYGKDITFDFLEESYGFGSPQLEVTMLEEPVMSEISESTSSGSSKYRVIGIAEGCFAPIGVMSRNGRLYDEDHWPFILENLNVANKIETRRMLGTIGHHDKKVDDEDLANGDVSHVVSELSIKEAEDGSKYVFGKLEILDTPAGNLLKSYYDAGIPLFVSSRGGGKLIQRANESFKRVDKNNFYLETWDVVREPGFLEAKPKYISEGITEEVTEENITEAYNKEENNMKKENETPKTVVDTKMDAEEIVNRLLDPLGEQLNALADKVSALSEKFAALEKVSEDTPVEEVSEDATEATEEANTEVSEETKEPAPEAVEEVSEEKAEEAPAEETVSEEATEEAPEATEEVSEEAEEKAEETPAEVSEGCHEEPKEDKEEKEDDKEEDKAEEKIEEATEEAPEATEEVSEEKEEDKEDKAEEKEDDKEEKEEAEECHEAVEETAIDYEAEYKRSLEVAEKLEKAVEKAMDVVKTISEERDTLKADIEAKEKAISESLKELHKYKLCEEFSISLEEASAKLAEKDYEAIREELLKEAEETTQSDEVSEAVADAKEELVEAISEAKVERRIAKVHSVFAPINEGKKSSKVHSVFND